MKFGGTDQLTDALWYLLANMKITFGLEGLQYVIWAWEGSLLKIDFTGTGVGVIPAGYETSIKLDGCPVLSPVMNVNLKSKAKDGVPSHGRASKTLKIEREVKIGDMLINMFEVPADSGSIVVLPYPISADGSLLPPYVVFILLGLTSEDGSLDSVASQYRRLIDQQLTNRGDKLEEKLDESTK
ncbi:hypothetical protein DPMN_141248 [Dreissena polymorpha]|uniref:Uncharacterized protein n=1 Tax=Dreissena polymorpha TaxID=45954 RepID=A0A9D4JJQ7_DREPO|nr:hypothetical protein DPMN_141248 [Dreissena polymorpha]